MKVIAINGSPRAKGNTAYAIQKVLTELENQGIETEIIHIGNKKISGCMGCNNCYKTQDDKCIIESDDMNIWIEKIKEADGIIFGSPVFWSGINGTMKSFMDRLFYVAGVHNLFRHKVGASVVAVRRSGGLPTFNQLNTYLNYSEMVIATSNYWNVIHGLKPGDAKEDAEGNQIMEVLGKNMAWLLKSLEASKDLVEKPQITKKIMTNFVR
jgi:multimeric flavodoxin WrbA